MIQYIFGWLSFFGVFIGSLFYLWNVFQPTQTESRVKLHCYIGLITLVPTVIHVYVQITITFSNDVMTWFGTGFYFIMIAFGVILLYLPEAGMIRYYARSIHPALFVGVAITVIHHLLRVYGIL
jgi:hypothetical protein